MFCEAYNQPLTDAAAAGELSPALQRHLASCAACHEAFAQEQSLFTAIESSLSVVANSEIPATLIPRFRAALNDEPTPWRHSYSFLLWGFASAAVTAGVVLALLLPSKHPSVPIESFRTSPIVSTQNRPNPPALNSTRMHGVSFLQHKKPAVLVASRGSETEVLVSPEEGDALLRYEESLRRKQGVVLMASAKSDDVAQGIEPLRIPELELGDLKIPALPKPLSDGQAK